MKISAVSGCDNRSKTHQNSQSFKALVGEREFIRLAQTTVTNIPARSVNALTEIVEGSAEYFNNRGFKNIVVNFSLDKSAQNQVATKVLCTAHDYDTFPPKKHVKDLTEDLLDLSSENPKKSAEGIKRDLKSWFKKFAGGKEIDETPPSSSSSSSCDVDMDEIWETYSGYGMKDSAYT